MTDRPIRYYNKLIRDKQLDFIRADGLVPKWRIVEGYELLQALAFKLTEEADEVAKEIIGHRRDGIDRDAVIEELADLMSVVHKLIELLNPEDGHQKVGEAIANKVIERGSFDQGILLESVSVADPREAEEAP